jgi:hypothetical protein
MPGPEDNETLHCGTVTSNLKPHVGISESVIPVSRGTLMIIH